MKRPQPNCWHCVHARGTVESFIEYIDNDRYDVGTNYGVECSKHLTEKSKECKKAFKKMEEK